MGCGNGWCRIEVSGTESLQFRDTGRILKTENMKKLHIYILAAALLSVSSCQKYLDIVPDNIPTIENAFTMRTSAERFLFM